MVIELLQQNPKISIIIIAAIVTLISSLVTKFLTDQEHLKNLKARQKKLQEELKTCKGDVCKMKEIQSEMLQITAVMMKSSFKPMFVTLIPFLMIFYWIRNIYNPILPSWFWYYLAAGIVSSIIFRKWLKMA
jgi:uncharacterized membrane protein (DUF106 family)